MKRLALIILCLVPLAGCGTTQVVTTTQTVTTPAPVHQTARPAAPQTIKAGAFTYRVDVSHPRPPCPARDAVSSATGNAYCVVSPPPAQTHTQASCPAGQYSYGTSHCYGAEPQQGAATSGQGNQGVSPVVSCYSENLNAQQFDQCLGR